VAATLQPCRTPCLVGQLYGRGPTATLPWTLQNLWRSVGQRSYQSLYRPSPVTLLSLPLMPSGTSWPRRLRALAAWPVLAASTLVDPVAGRCCRGTDRPGRAQRGARRVSQDPGDARAARPTPADHRLHASRPAHGAAHRAFAPRPHPWRRRSVGVAWPITVERTYWRESWRPPEEWVQALEKLVKAEGVAVRRGGDYDEWTSKCAAERWRRPRPARHRGARRRQAARALAPLASPSIPWVIVAPALALCATVAALDGAWVAAFVLAAGATVLGWRIATDCGPRSGRYERRRILPSTRDQQANNWNHGTPGGVICR